MRGYFPKSVSDYTKKQCQEYLEKFPNGLNAESVKNRLELLTRCQKVDLQQSERKEKSGKNSSSKQKAAIEKKLATKTEDDSGTKVWEVIIAIIVFVRSLFFQS